MENEKKAENVKQPGGFQCSFNRTGRLLTLEWFQEIKRT
jgi:hypothetical protein